MQRILEHAKHGIIYKNPDKLQTVRLQIKVDSSCVMPVFPCSEVHHCTLCFSIPQAALTLPERPFLHCSTVIPAVCLMLKFIMHLLKLKDSWCFLPWMLFISWTSHHVRDGVRHGLWICPFGKTAPLPYWLYVAITASLPHFCSFIMYLTGTREMMSIKHGIRIDV